MRWQLALGVGIVFGLGLAAWIERDRVAAISAQVMAWYQGAPETTDRADQPVGVARLPDGEIPDQPAVTPDGPDPSTEAPAAPAVPQTVDGLYAALRAADSAEEAQRLEVELFNRTAMSRSPSVNALMDAAARADAAGDYAGARAIYADVLAIEPAYAEAWSRTAGSAYQMGDPASALGELRRAVALDPRHFAAWAGLATVLEEAGYLEDAEKAWAEAVYWNPMSDASKRGLARVRAVLRGVDL